MDATGSDGNVTISGADIAFNGSALVQTEDGVAPFDGVLTLTSTGSISQSNNAALVTGLLQGSSSGATNLNGINEVTNLGNFAADGGFAFTDTADGLNITGDVATVDSDIAINVTGDLDVTGSVDATGGDVNLYQTGIFSAVVDAIRTAVSGAITLQQNDGGSINDAVQSVDNSGNGLNTINVAAGTYNENIDVTEANFLLLGAQNGEAGTEAARVGGESVVSSSSGDVLDITANNVTVDGFTFSGSNSSIEVNGPSSGSNLSTFSIVNNRFVGTGSEGFEADNADNITVSENFFGNSQDGIELDDVDGVEISDNIFKNTTSDAIDADNADNLTIISNTFTGNGSGDGIYVEGSTNVTIGGSNGDRNTVSGFARGIVMSDNDAGTKLVSFNTVNGNDAGIVVSGDDNVTVHRNDLDTNGIGVLLEDNAQGTIVTNNTIANSTEAGLRVAAEGILATIFGAGSEMADFSNNTFTGFGTYISNRALNVTIDGSDNTFELAGGNFKPKSVGGSINATELAKLFELEDMTDHSLDNGLYGKVSYIANNWFVTQNSGSIQRGVNTASSDDTVWVDAGTFNENVSITKSLTLYGAQYGVDGNDGSRGTGETVVTNGSGSLFQIFADNITVDGFTFTGADRGIEVNSTILNTVDNITLVNNRFDNVGAEGIYADTVNSLNVETSYFTGGTDAIEIDGGSTLTVTDNTFVSVGEDGLDVDDVDGVVVTSNNLDGAGDAGFKFAASSDVTVGGSNANRNTIANAARGVVFDGGVTGMQEVSFNTFNTNTVGVDVDGDHDVLVDKNDFDDNTTGVRVTDANDVDVTRNVFNNGTDDVVASGSDDLFVDNNEFNSTNGVKVTGGSDAVVQRNDFFNSNYGVQLFNTTNAVIGNDTLGGLRNTFDGVEYAVYASGTTDTLVSRNRIDDAEVAIEFVDGSGGTIQRNTIDGEGSEQLCFGSFCLPIFLPTYGDTAIQVSNQAGVTVDRNTVEGFDNGLYGNNANDLVLSKNTFTGRDLLGISLGTAVEVENSTGVEIGGDPRSDFRNTISNYNNGIVFSNVDNGLIQNNLVQDSLLGTAITLENGSDGNTLDANRIIDVRKAISLSGSDSNVITANDIDDISNNAIELTSGSDSNQVNGNFVDNADRGFRVSGASNGNSFDGNRVRNGGNGAYVTDSTGTSFTGNTFSQLSRDAVYLSNAGTTTLTNNTISFVDYGVYATGSDDLTVTGGTIRDTNEAGVSVNGGENATVELVTLRRTDGNGIEVFDNTGTVTLDTNDVRRATANGIYVFNSSGSVLGNTANANEGNGIFVDESSNVDVDDNFANNNDLNGIYVNDSSNIGVDGNQANNNDLNGIYANAVSSSEFNGNTANSNDASHGIFVQDSNNVTLDGNTTNANAVAGIFVDPSENIGVVNNTANGNEIGIWFDEVTNGSIFNNTTDNNADAGIAVDNSTQISIDANASNVGNDVGIRVTDSDSVFMRDQVISDSLTTGVQVSGDSNNIILSNSTISNSGTYGVFAEGAEIGSITLSGNTLNNNDVQARFESGLLDISDLTNPNTLNGGRIGFQFDPASNDFQDMLLVNDTFGATEFFGQSEFYIELLDGAFFDVANNSPLVLNALDANFDGFIPNNSEFGPGILTLEQFNAIQAKLYDLNDEAGRGLVFAGSVPGLSEEDIFSTALTNFTLPGSGFAVTLAGLPFISADSAAALNALVTAAGDSAEDLANIETAAGGEDYGCWTDVGASLDGTTYYNNSVTFSFSNDVGETLNDQAGCGQ